MRGAGNSNSVSSIAQPVALMRVVGNDSEQHHLGCFAHDLGLNVNWLKQILAWQAAHQALAEVGC